jgi:hypothetical protein
MPALSIARANSICNTNELYRLLYIENILRNKKKKVRLHGKKVRLHGKKVRLHGKKK